MNKVFTFIQKNPFRVKNYGSLKRLVEVEGEYIKPAIQTLYNSYNFELEDYDDDVCWFGQRTIDRAKNKRFL